MSVHTRLGSGGRLVVPAEYREALGLKQGDPVVLVMGDGVLQVLSRDAAVKRAQSLVARTAETAPSMVDELLAERRAEAAAESAGEGVARR